MAREPNRPSCDEGCCREQLRSRCETPEGDCCPDSAWALERYEAQETRERALRRRDETSDETSDDP